MHINIEKLSNENFKVTIDGTNKTVHIVNLSNDSYLKLTNGKLSKQRLIELSFKFLLERESNTAILAKFSLPEISKYFFDYIENVNKWCFKQID